MSGDTENTPVTGEDRQSVSGEQEGTSSPVETTALVERIATLEAQLRGLQKSGDKRYAETSKTVHEVKDEFDRIAKYLGVSAEEMVEARRNMVLDDLIEGRSARGEQQPFQGESDVADNDDADLGGSVDRETLEFLGFDPNAKDVVRMVRKGFTKEDFLVAAQARGLQRQQNPGSLAAIQSSGEGRNVLASEEEQAVLQEQYERERDELRERRLLNPRTFHNLKKKYREKGLPIT